MKTIKMSFNQMLSASSLETTKETTLEMAIANRIQELMTKHGLRKKQLALALGKRPSEVTKWLSGQHNFTVRTLCMLSSFFGEPVISIV